MNKIRNKRGSKKSSPKTDRPAEDTGAAKAADEPLSPGRRAKPAAARRQNRARAAAANSAAKGQPQEKRSLLKGLFGFLGNHRDNAAEQSAADEAFTAPSLSGWTAQEKRILANIAELHAARVADIMIPRSDIEALDLDKTLAETLQLFEQSGHSRMPVYKETLDDPRGMIHIRDVLNYITRLQFGGGNGGKILALPDFSAPIGSLGLRRDVLFVPASMPAGRLLARMQASRTQMALVIDEHGGTDGLVSMEDIVELIVGDIEDEHDEDDTDIVKEAQDSWVIDAATELEELKDRLGIDFAENSLAQEVDTLGGLIVTALDRIPARGEKVEIIPQYLFQILDADRRRIKRIRLIRIEPQAERQTAEAG